MSTPRRSLGILSWRGHDSLSRTLPTFAAARLFELFDEAVLLLPEAAPETVELGRSFGLDVRTTPDNLGILGGFKALAEGLRAPILTLLEDDCALVEPHGEVARQLTLAEGALASDSVQVFRLRHRFYPGDGKRFHVLTKLHRYHPSENAAPREQAMARLRRMLRPGKAKKMASNILYEDSNAMQNPYDLLAKYQGEGPPLPPQKYIRSATPQEIFPDLIRKHSDGYYQVSARSMPWSNQSIMIGRDFFLKQIIGYAEAHPRRRRVNGFPDIEKELNSPYWRHSGWWVGTERGLFSHEIV